MIDLTTLEGADTPGKVRSLCAKALRPDPADPTVPPVAAVCVYADLVDASRVEAPAAAAACTVARGRDRVPVAGARRSRSSSPTSADAVAAGADEIDMVIDRGAFLAGRYGLVFDRDRRASKEACGAGAPQGDPRDRRARDATTTSGARRGSRILAGGDFIKTSTGKVSPGRDAAGRARDARGRARLAPRRPARRSASSRPAASAPRKDAIQYLVTVAEIAGEDWLQPHLFRFGASSLLNDVLLQRQKLATGRYAGPDYVTID